MMQIAQTIFQELTAILQRRIQSAQERVQTTEDERMNRYYKGQADTLSLVLHDIDALKFDFGMELNPELQKTNQPQAEIFSPAPKLEKPVKRKGRAQKSKVEAAPVFTYEALAQQAVKWGIIDRKISHFYHELLPGKRVKGYPALYRALEDNEEFRQAIQEAIKTQAAQEQDRIEIPGTDPHGAAGYAEETPSFQERISVEVSPSDPHRVEE